MGCAEHRHHLDLYLDEELETDEALALEAHFTECVVCFEYVRRMRNFRARLREADSEAVAPLDLRQAVLTDLDHVDRRRLARRALQTLPLVAAAAAAALLYGRDLPVLRPLVEPIVAAHAGNLPMEVKGEDPEKVTTWFRGKVPFAVRPPQFRQPEIRLMGARLAHLREREAAYITYQRRGARFSLFVFDPQEPDLELKDTQVRQIKNRPVYLAHRKGFSVVMWRDRQLVYSLTSEAGEQELLSMAENVVSP